MPIINGVRYARFLDWCSVHQAVGWIESRLPPIENNEFPDISYSTASQWGPFWGITPGKGRTWAQYQEDGRNRLLAFAQNGAVSLKGSPLMQFSRQDILASEIMYEPDTVGFEEFIRQDSLNLPGTTKLIGDQLFYINDGDTPGNTIIHEENWAYINVKVDVRQLIQHTPPTPAQKIYWDEEEFFIALPAFQITPADTSQRGKALRPPRQNAAHKQTEKPEAPPPITSPTTNAGDTPSITPPKYTDGYMRTDEAAAYLKISKSLLEKLRITGDGPAYSKPSRICLYRLIDLDQWAAQSRRRNTSEK